MGPAGSLGRTSGSPGGRGEDSGSQSLPLRKVCGGCPGGTSAGRRRPESEGSVHCRRLGARPPRLPGPWWGPHPPHPPLRGRDRLGWRRLGAGRHRAWSGERRGRKDPASPGRAGVLQKEAPGQGVGSGPARRCCCSRSLRSVRAGAAERVTPGAAGPPLGAAGPPRSARPQRGVPGPVSGTALAEAGGRRLEEGGVDASSQRPAWTHSLRCAHAALVPRVLRSPMPGGGEGQMAQGWEAAGGPGPAGGEGFSRRAQGPGAAGCTGAPCTGATAPALAGRSNSGAAAPSLRGQARVPGRLLQGA